MTTPLRVLIVEDAPDDAVLLVRELRRGGYTLTHHRVETPEAMTEALETQTWDIIIADYSLPRFSAPAALQLLHEQEIDLPFIVVSGAIGEELAVETMRLGAHDYLMKGHLARLVPAIKRELREAQERRERRRAEKRTRREADRAEALLRVAARLNTQLDLDAVITAVCEETVRALNIYAVSAYLYDEQHDTLYLASAYGLPPTFMECPHSLARATYDQYVPREDPVIVLPEVHTIAGLFNGDLAERLNIHTMALARMVRKGQLVGILNLMIFGEEHLFTENELALLRGLADQAAMAIANARLFEESERRLKHLQALRNIDMTITTSLDLRVILTAIIDQITRLLHVDAACVLLDTPQSSMLEYAAGHGFRSRALQHTRLQMGEGYAGSAALERQLVSIPNLNLSTGDFARAPLLTEEEFVAYYAVSLTAKGAVKGVLELFHRAPLDPDQEWIDFLEALAGQAAIAIDNAELFNSLQHSKNELTLAYDATLEGWSHALDLRDKETEGHTQRVTEMTVHLAQLMGVNDADLVHIRRGALLHDIGKMGIPDGVLLKPGPLTEEEWAIMRMHPVYAYQWLAPISFLRPALDIPYCHHEKWDGTGYPRGLRGEQIPFAARIFAVIDVWDALCSERPYHAAWPRDKVLEYVRSLSGSHFDPQVVTAFLDHFSQLMQIDDRQR